MKAPKAPRARAALPFIALVTLLQGCASQAPIASFTAPNGQYTPAEVTPTPLNTPAGTCDGAFAPVELAHFTQPSTEVVHQFESNGTGVAVNDLNNDGLLDIVLANIDGPSSIFWNRGEFAFDKQELNDSFARAVNILDVDGDGWMDISFTHIKVGPSYWHNTGVLGADGTAAFEHASLPGVNQYAHSMAWADLNGDNQLDLVTGVYDAELNTMPGGQFLFTDGAGVLVYTQKDGRFTAQRLAKQSQALVIALLDVTGDDRPDILIGNDFDTPDMAWQNTPAGWQEFQPWQRSSQHTMSYDWADIDNNGSFEFFATDMYPYQVDLDELAQWVPMMNKMPHRLSNIDVQRAQNVLQIPDGKGGFSEEADVRGVLATGWGWSSHFGDLDNDGYQDLYSVNGMIDQQIFGYLPGGELVEQNQAFVNQRDGRFGPMPQWNLGGKYSGRGMVLADLNNDGALDAVINNLRNPAQVYKNQLCQGSALEVDLAWPGSGNTRAIGAKVLLHTSAGSQLRDVRASSAYLSGDPARVHFGIADGTQLLGMEIRWPDGAVTRLDGVDGGALQAGSLLRVTR